MFGIKQRTWRGMNTGVDVLNDVKVLYQRLFGITKCYLAGLVASKSVLINTPRHVVNSE